MKKGLIILLTLIALTLIIPFVNASCVDSDGGIMKNIKGVTEGINYDGERVVEEDYCTNPVGQKLENGSCGGGYGCMIEEFYCLPLYGNSSNLIVDSNGYNCLNGCKEGACINNDSSCKSLYWFDNENKECGQKQFCGMYMYYGLHTFESREQCLNHVNETEPCPQLALPSPDWCKNGTIESEKDENGCSHFKCYKNLSNGRKAEIKIMPDTASEKAIERLGELGFNITLKEVGKGDDVKVVYELTGNKQGKFLGIFKIIARVKAQVDAENGDVKIIKPWWSFLATKI